MASDEYKAKVLLKAESGEKLSPNEQHEFNRLKEESGTERGSRARNALK